MAAARNNNEIVKGSKLMVFIDDAPVGFATSHTLSITTNTTEVNTKDNGDYPSVIVQSIGWEVTAENLYSDAGESVYMDKLLAKTPVTLVFAPASNWTDADEKGVLDPDGHADWQAGTAIVTGNALISSLNVNAPAGDNATLSVTFTGVGPLTQGS